MIQAAGGPRSIDAFTVLSILQGTAPPRDLSPLFAQAVGAGRSGFVTVSALGDVSNNPDYLTVTYIGQDNEYLDTLTIDGQKAGLIFDTSANTSPALEISSTVGIEPSDITFEPTGSPGLPNLVLSSNQTLSNPGMP